MSNCVVSSNTKLLHFFCFLLLHLLLSFLSPRRCSFSASFFFFLFFFLHFFTSIASSHLLLLLSFFLFFFQLFTLMLLRVLLYFFMGLFVFESVGFVWAYAKEGETTVGFLFMGCVCCAVVGLRVGIGGFGLLVVVGGEVAPALASAPAKCSSFG